MTKAYVLFYSVLAIIVISSFYAIMTVATLHPKHHIEAIKKVECEMQKGFYVCHDALYLPEEK
jgi:hypothetical protein